MPQNTPNALCTCSNLLHLCNRNINNEARQRGIASRDTDAVYFTAEFDVETLDSSAVHFEGASLPTISTNERIHITDQLLHDKSPPFIKLGLINLD